MTYNYTVGVLTKIPPILPMYSLPYTPVYSLHLR